METSKKPRLRVFLADDHPLVLEGMKARVLSDPDLELVGEAVDGLTALHSSVELRPDVLVLDLSMPGMNGVDVASNMRVACPETRILVLTVHEDGAYLRKVLDLGVAGYVLKRSVTEELIRGIHAVGGGGVYLDPAIAGRAIGRDAFPAHEGADLAKAPDLSKREREVIRLAAAGHSIKTIAAKLGLGVKSVETYKVRAMAKLGLRSRVEVVQLALRKGWLKDAG
jgi:DNA-binding NarL/FixJ family response regulator